MNELITQTRDLIHSSLQDRRDQSQQFMWFRKGLPVLSTPTSQRSPGDAGLTEMVIGPSDVDQVEIYQPLLTEPGMYLAFSEIGEKSWQLRQSKDADIQVAETAMAQELVEKFGTLNLSGVERNDPFVTSFMSDFSEIDLPTVWDVLDEARSVNLIMLAHKYALTGSSDPKEMYGTHRESSFRINSELIGSLYKIRQGQTPGEVDPLPEHKPQSIADLGINRESAADAITATVNRHLMTENVRSTISSRFLPISGKSPAVSVEPGWTKEFQTNSLRGALWIQVSNHIVSGANWRECANESCTNLFRVDRPTSTKKYCTDECRDQVNNRKYYNKRSGTSHAK